MNKTAFLFWASCLLLRRVEAAEILTETFSYAEGVLSEVSGGAWQRHSGTDGPVRVERGRVLLSASRAEDVNVILPGGPFSTGSYYVGFRAAVLNRAGTAGNYFLHFRTAAGAFRARVCVAGGTNSATVVFGVNSGAAGENAVYHAKELAAGAEARCVLRVDTESGETALWVDAAEESDLSVRTLGAGGFDLSSLALRQASGAGELSLDDLRIGTTFDEVRPALGGAPVLPPLLVFTGSLSGLIRSGDLTMSTNVLEYSVRPGELLRIDAEAFESNGGAVRIESENNPAWVAFTGDVGNGTARGALEMRPSMEQSGSYAEVAIRAVAEGGFDRKVWKIYVPAAAESGVVINEFLANPPSQPDAAHFNALARAVPVPSERTSVEDEYVELWNVGDEEVALAGWTLEDNLSARHTFGEQDTLPKGGSFVVYGGAKDGSVARIPGRAAPANGGTAGLSLNNTGDWICLRNSAGRLVARAVFKGSDLSGAASLTRNPDGNGQFLAHDAVSVASASPGRRVDGTAFETPGFGGWQVRIARTASGSVALTWPVQAGQAYSVWRTESLAMPFRVFLSGLTFETEKGEVEIPAGDGSSWFQLSCP